MKINKFLSLVVAGMLAVTTAATGAISLPGGVAKATDPSYTSWKIKIGSTVVAQAGAAATDKDYAGALVPATGKSVYIEPGASITLTAATTGSGHAGYTTSYSWTLNDATDTWIQEAVDNVTATGTSITVNTRASFTAANSEKITLNITEKKDGDTVNYTALSINLKQAVKKNTDTFIVVDPDAYNAVTMAENSPATIGAATYTEKGDTSYTWFVNGADPGELSAGFKDATGNVAVAAADPAKDSYVYWTSSNPAVAVVGDNSAHTVAGNSVAVTAKGVGTTTITAKLYKRTNDVDALPEITTAAVATATFTLEVKTAIDTVAVQNVTDDAALGAELPLIAGKAITLKATASNSSNPNPSFFPISTNYVWAFHDQTSIDVVNDAAAQYFSVSSLSGNTITVTAKGNCEDDKFYLAAYATSSKTYDATKTDDYKDSVGTKFVKTKISATGVQRKLITVNVG